MSQTDSATSSKTAWVKARPTVFGNCQRCGAATVVNVNRDCFNCYRGTYEGDAVKVSWLKSRIYGYLVRRRLKRGKI